MSAADFSSLLGYVLTCSFTPGPGNILALNTTSTYGWKRSRPLIFGICLGYAIVQTICAVVLSESDVYIGTGDNTVYRWSLYGMAGCTYFPQ